MDSEPSGFSNEPMNMDNENTTMDLDSGSPIMEKKPFTFDKEKAIKRWTYSLVFVVLVIIVRVGIFYFYGR